MVFDYDMAVPPNVTFGVNITSSDLMIPLVNDDTAEPDEQFTVNLEEITPNVVVGTFTANVTIINDDCELHNSIHEYLQTLNLYMKSLTYILQ